MIQAYYAAFYSAHSILRFFGKSFTHLEPGHVNFLKKRCISEAGYTPKLSSSYYLIALSPEDRNVSFSNFLDSHRHLWSCFQNLLQEISSEALAVRASEQRRQDLSHWFAQLAEALSERGRHPAGNWLSLVRNEISYKSEHGVWFPFEKSTPGFDMLMAKVKDWRKCSNDLGDPNLVRNDRERFFITAFVIIDLALAIAFDYQKITPKIGRRSTNFSHLINLSAAA